jgi:hypothetical protein
MKTPETTSKPSNQHLWQTFTMEESMKTQSTSKFASKFWLILVTLATLLLGACSQQPIPKETEDLESQLIPTFWKQMGGALDVNPIRNSRSPALAVNVQGDLYATWTEDSSGLNSNKISVKRLVGNTWTSMGTELNVESNKVAITRPDGAIAVKGFSPAVAFHECASISFPSDCNVYVKRWNGAEWVQLGGKLNTNSAYYASIVIGEANRPVVAWFEKQVLLNAIGYNIYVKRWDGAKWVSLGGAVNPSFNKLASMPSLAYKNGKIAVAWQQCATTGNLNPLTCQHQIFVRSYDAASNTWKEFLLAPGAINVNANRDAKLPSLELTSDGTPLVAFVECVQVGVACHELADHNVYVKRYGTKVVNGLLIAGFHLLGNALDVKVAQATNWPSLAMGLNDTPAVAWSEGGSTGAGFAGIRVKTWNASLATWKAFSGVSDASLNISQTQHSGEASLVISSTGKPSVAFQEGQEGGNGVLMNIYVRQLQQQ